MADIGCSPNAARAFDFLLGKGLRDFQAASVVGNLQQESGLNPRADARPREAATGIAQWHEPRWGALLAFAAGSGRDPWSFDVQLEFLWHELETDPKWGLAQLRASTTLEEATVTFQDRFERCGDCRTPTRIALARNALYACPSVQPPESTSKKVYATFVVGAALGLVSLVGYGLYRAFSTPEPEPLPPRPLPPRPYRYPEPF